MNVRLLDKQYENRNPLAGFLAAVGWTTAVMVVTTLMTAGGFRADAAGTSVPTPPPLLAGPAEDALPEENTTVTRRDVTSPDNPYRPIVARNAFRLREPVPPPPPPTNPPAAPEPVKIDVKLAGLAQIQGVRYAYLMVPDTERPGQFLYPSLTDDPERGKVRHGSGLEVREIDIKKQTVRVVNGGIEATLNFKENGLKKENVPGVTPAAKPGAIPAPGTPGAVPVLNRAGATTKVFPAGGGGMPQPPVAQPSGNEPLVFSRNPNRASSGGNGNAFAPIVGGTGVVTPNNPGSGVNVTPNVPVRNVRTDSGMPAVPSIPLEQQYDVLIRQRQAAESIGIRLPPIPGMPEPAPVP